MIEYQEVLDFWFKELVPSQWYKKDEQLDAQMTERFGECLQVASVSELFEWRRNIEGRLAEIIVLDQFSRNIYRHSPKAFASDPLALSLAQEAVFLGKPCTSL